MILACGLESSSGVRSGSLAFEAFVQEQVDLFDELVNTACGLSSAGNENADDNQNDNG